MKIQPMGQQNSGDEGNIAIREEQRHVIFRKIDRESHLLPKYGVALLRLEKGSMASAGIPESLLVRGLLLRPAEELSIEAKTREEKSEVQYRKK